MRWSLVVFPVAPTIAISAYAQPLGNDRKLLDSRAHNFGTLSVRAT